MRFNNPFRNSQLHFFDTGRKEEGKEIKGSFRKKE
jgi:hypothetical protein